MLLHSKAQKKEGNVAFQFRAIIGWQYNAAVFAGNVIRPLSENQTHFVKHGKLSRLFSRFNSIQRKHV